MISLRNTIQELKSDLTSPQDVAPYRDCHDTIKLQAISDRSWIMATLSRNERPKNETFCTVPVRAATSILITAGGAGTIVIAACGAVASVGTTVRYCELVAVILSASLCQL